MKETIDADSRTITVHAWSEITDFDRVEFIERNQRWLVCDKRGYWSCKPVTRQEEWPIFKTARQAIDWAIKEYGA